MKNLHFIFIGLCITTSTITLSFDNPFMPVMEVIKATGIGQKELQYSNHIDRLIRNGNQLAFITALAVKYGYNPVNNNFFKTPNATHTAFMAKDLAQYLVVSQQVKAELALEMQKKASSHQPLMLEGGAQALASVIGYKLLKLLPLPFKVLTIPCFAYVGIIGTKKTYDGVFYQEYLESKMQQNQNIEEVVKKAAGTLASQTPVVTKTTFENIKKKLTGEK